MTEFNLYYCMMMEADPIHPFIQNYWAYSDSVGEAITKIIAAAKAWGLNNPRAKQINLYDIQNLDCEVIYNSAQDIFWSESRIFFPPEPDFDIPFGVIGAGLEGENDINEIQRGYAYTKNEELVRIDVNVEDAELLSVYFDLIRLFEKFKVFWYVLHKHWDNSENDLFLVNEELNTASKIEFHLQNNVLDSVKNGYVTITAYVEEGATNINVSDHKKIVILTYSTALAERIYATLEKRGLNLFDPFISIVDGIHHWHYRSPNSRDKADLIAYLKEIGFREWSPKK